MRVYIFGAKHGRYKIAVVNEETQVTEKRIKTFPAIIGIT